MDIQALLRAAQVNELPEDFQDWHLATPDGWSVAHEMARQRCLPSEFNQWHLTNKTGVSVAHVAAQYGHLPTNFIHWHIANHYGWSVAHQAARSYRLPQHFSQWTIANCVGWSVAHEAAYWHRLPPDFDQWHIADYTGWSVAHESARYGRLPSDFDQWDIADYAGWTVAHEAVKQKRSLLDFDGFHWLDSCGQAVASVYPPPRYVHYAHPAIVLPEKCNDSLPYCLWHEQNMAHWAVTHRHQPSDDFDGWHWLNDDPNPTTVVYASILMTGLPNNLRYKHWKQSRVQWGNDSRFTTSRLLDFFADSFVGSRLWRVSSV